MTEHTHSDWGDLQPEVIERLKHAVADSVTEGIEALLTDPKKINAAIDAFVSVASDRGAEVSGRWLWRQVAGVAWWGAKGLAIVACILYFGGGWPAVVAFLKIKGST